MKSREAVWPCSFIHSAPVELSFMYCVHIFDVNLSSSEDVTQCCVDVTQCCVVLNTASLIRWEPLRPEAPEVAGLAEQPPEGHEVERAPYTELRPDMTGADLGHHVCLAELGSAAASLLLFGSALLSGQGLSLGPKATLTLERNGHFGQSLRMGMQAGPADWTSRDGTGLRRDGRWNPSLYYRSVLGTPSCSCRQWHQQPQKIQIQTCFSKFSVCI
ncbi:hypothetical protein DPX16_17471 [Anabarilius grahami]|uniref:Uncharacterized protein n=1 Tax=Anabarilius grahami TaxID=495550 RepID=A0A3N0XZ40_ANAGA|nr:hypothetical protein DPX16_17471 [Anabarilius grahami]